MKSTRKRDNQRDAIVLGANYLKENINIVFERLEMGGARLASVLSRACAMKNN